MSNTKLCPFCSELFEKRRFEKPAQFKNRKTCLKKSCISAIRSQSGKLGKGVKHSNRKGVI